jgi:hypothetical protein
VSPSQTGPFGAVRSGRRRIAVGGG